MWRRVDLGLVAVVAIAAITRGFQLSSPGRLYFDEFYAQDACVYLGLSESICGLSTEASWMHPPLGKWLISTGIALVGFEPIAWRLAPAAAGIVMVGLVHVLTRRLTKSALGAALAGGLVALDPLSIVMSRIAMLDTFTACAGVATVLFVVLAREQLERRRQGGRGSSRPWLIAAGVAAGVAVATKWSGVLAVGVAVLLVVAWEVSAARRSGRTWLSGVGAAVPSVVGWLIVLPAAIYVISYAGRLDGELVAVPWQEGAWVRQFVERQVQMLDFHVGLDLTHPYASPAWSWLLGKRPVALLIETGGAGRVREILAFVNPLVWLPGLAAAAAACVVAARRGRLWGPELVIAAGVAGTYLPWLMLAGGRSQVFAYYILPTLPFLAVALGWAAAELRTAGRSLAGALAAVSIVVVLFWSPLIYGWPLDDEARQARIIFADCSDAEGQGRRLAPRRDSGPPPTGWCWA